MSLLAFNNSNSLSVFIIVERKVKRINNTRCGDDNTSSARLTTLIFTSGNPSTEEIKSCKSFIPTTSSRFEITRETLFIATNNYCQENNGMDREELLRRFVAKKKEKDTYKKKPIKKTYKKKPIKKKNL
jgi:hypothetical protein